MSITWEISIKDSEQKEKPYIDEREAIVSTTVLYARAFRLGQTVRLRCANIIF